jgi:hypothetical protein
MRVAGVGMRGCALSAHDVVFVIAALAARRVQRSSAMLALVRRVACANARSSDDTRLPALGAASLVVVVVVVVVATEEGVVVDDDVDGVVERDVANNDTTTVNKHAASKFCSNNVCKSYIHKVSSSSSSFVTIMTKGEKTRIDQLYELLIVLLTDYL